ncbi:MAG: hypothetical protein WAN65_20145 [Candidatus Sulfotelmatobacter sp.]
MTDEHLIVHVPDSTLLLYGSEELPRAEGIGVSAHLRKCSKCSVRLEEINGRLAEFSQAYRQAIGPKLPPADESRIALASRLAKMRSQPRRSFFAGVGSAVTPSRGGYALAGLVLVLVFLGAIYRREIQSGSQQISASLGLWVEPRANLTPGATLPMTKAQVCAALPEQTIRAVPISLQREVFAMYGVKKAAPEAYEVDYLITPELGGATDIRNLWPEPYYDTAWNAHVKDQLEERLHEMVCRGDVDLATAQQDISRDWIAAYRKYFHTDHPIADKTSLHQL